MENGTAVSGPSALIPAFVLAAFVAGAPAAAAAAPVQDSPCPSTIEVGGQTATLTAFVCGSASASVGTPWPISIGVTVGHCTGCDCGYVFEGPAGSQFTRRGAGDCGWGSAGGGSGGSGVDGDGSRFQDDAGEGCQWGRDYLGWGERGGC